jgi:hypothetical protein
MRLALSAITACTLAPIEPEVHRHVRRVGDQRADRVEHGAGEVEPLLDVDRVAVFCSR